MYFRCRPNWLLGVLGLLLAALFTIYLHSHRYFLEGPVWLFTVGIAIVTTLSVSLAFGSYWLSQQGFSNEDEWRILIWVLVGLVGTVTLTFWPIFYQGIVGNSVKDPFFILISSAGIGLNAGLITGIYDIRSRKRLHRTQNARDSLSFVNRLLRHDINNAVTVIGGRAELLRQEVTDDESGLDTIKDQCDSIEELISEARMLSELFNDTPDLEPIDLRSLVESQLSTTDKVYDNAKITLDRLTEATVEADTMLTVVVSNLVSNAIEHNDSDTPLVEIAVEQTDTVARLHVADNGPGIDDGQKQQIFEPNRAGPHGIGMYLVKTLTERYGGEIWIEDSDLGGTLITVELPLA